jgi:hypothetical protein
VTTVRHRPKVVLLGLLTKMPVGGNAWLVAQYATGFQRLGFDVYYVECHGRAPSMFSEHEGDNASGRAAAFLADTLKRFGMKHRWAYHALHDDGRCYGMSIGELHRLYAEADLIVNLHGGTVPQEEHAATGRLVYMGTDPVALEVELYRGEQQAIDFLEPHVAFFTWGLNYGNPDCRLPWSDRFPFVPSPPPVVLDLWEGDGADGLPSAPFTTIGNWRQYRRDISFDGELYTWSKHHEFLKIRDLPRRVDQAFELALSSYKPEDETLLEKHGWRVRPGLPLSVDMDLYRDYIRGSRGELTAAKDQNVRLRTGWFSERSATYLAAGRPVIQQDTGFGNAFPTGEGVFAFTGVDDAAAAVEAINADYPRHRRAATEVAREYFNYDVVLVALLDYVGLGPGVGLRAAAAPTVDRAVPTFCRRRPDAPATSFVVATAGHDLATVRLGLEGLLADADQPPFEVIVVMDAGTDAATRQYVSVLAARNRNVVLANGDSSAAARAERTVVVSLAGPTTYEELAS